MADIYKIAAQRSLRFPSTRGLLSVENLFEMPLKSKGGFDLDTVARSINNDLKEKTQESFVDDPATDPEKSKLEIAMAIVKDVIATKQAENKAALNRQHKATERKAILDAMAAKKDQALSAASLEDLEKKLAALDEADTAAV